MLVFLNFIIYSRIKKSEAQKKGRIVHNEAMVRVFKVKNSGEPIQKGEEEKIFERFYRSDESRNRDSKRYGLGLSIAKSIVEKHNGKIKAYSNNGITTFTVIF